jgi:HEAT repeat protein
MFRVPLLPRTLDAALRDLGSAKPAVRVEAVSQLVPHAEGARDAVLAGLTGALADPAPQVRASAASALADLGAKEAVPALLALAEDSEVQVREMVFAALGELGDERALALVQAALSDPAAPVRFQATIAFPRLTTSGKEARSALLRRTSDEDALVCHVAIRMLEEELDEVPGALDARITARATKLLEHESPRVRVAAAILLARSGDATGHGVLVSVASGALRTEDGEDEAEAIELCGRLNLESAREGLAKRAFGRRLGFFRDRFAWHAKVALARLGDARAEAELARDLDARDRDARTLAVAAVGRARLTALRERLAAHEDDPSFADPNALREALALLSGAAEPSRAAPHEGGERSP